MAKKGNNGIARIHVEIEGTAPLIMHSGQLANPMNPAVKAIKEISQRKNKTDEEFALLAQMEWNGSLYFDTATGPYIPAENIEALIVAGSKQYKRGLAAKIKSSVQVEQTKVALNYEGPRTPDEMYSDPQFIDMRLVVVKQARLMRCRPRFEPPWSLKFDLVVVAQNINPVDVQRSIETGGAFCGIGDHRPRYGRFELKAFVQS